MDLKTVFQALAGINPDSLMGKVSNYISGEDWTYGGIVSRMDDRRDYQWNEIAGVVRAITIGDPEQAIGWLEVVAEMIHAQRYYKNDQFVWGAMLGVLESMVWLDTDGSLHGLVDDCMDKVILKIIMVPVYRDVPTFEGTKDSEKQFNTRFSCAVEEVFLIEDVGFLNSRQMAIGGMLRTVSQFQVIDQKLDQSEERIGNPMFTKMSTFEEHTSGENTQPYFSLVSKALLKEILYKTFGAMPLTEKAENMSNHLMGTFVLSKPT